MKTSAGVVTFPLSHAVPLANLIKLFSKLTDEVYVISGGAALKNLNMNKDVQIFEVTHKPSSNAFMRIINYMYTQLKILRYVIVVSRKVNFFVFFIGGEALLVSILALKLLRKKVIVMPGGIAVKGYSIREDPLSKFVSILIVLSLGLADKLIVYSQRLIQEGNFVKYQRKILVAHEHFVDFTRFTVRKKTNENINAVGYIGRLSEEKGILNFMKAIPLILEKRKDIHFLICGEGQLSDEIKKSIRNKEMLTRVKLTRWVRHEDVPRYLNKLKLLLLPSFTEGLPNILLEAIACGTPILATPVGAIPDIIKDGETGFLLESNDPPCIADRIIELLSKPELLKRVSIKAHRYVRENFSFQKTLESWQKIFSELNQS